MLNDEVWKVIILQTLINRFPLKEDKRLMFCWKLEAGCLEFEMKFSLANDEHRMVNNEFRSLEIRYC